MKTQIDSRYAQIVSEANDIIYDLLEVNAGPVILLYLIALALCFGFGFAVGGAQ